MLGLSLVTKRRGMGEVCFGLVQDIIDGLGVQKGKLSGDGGIMSYVPKFDVKYTGRDGLKGGKYWFTLDEVFLGLNISPKTKNKYIVRSTSGKSSGSGDISFGFQTIANIAKDIVFQNFSR